MRPLRPRDLPTLHGEPPPDRTPRAGVTCGWASPGHDRAILEARTVAELMRRIRDWRCRCGRPAYGEQPAGDAPAEPRRSR